MAFISPNRYDPDNRIKSNEAQSQRINGTAKKEIKITQLQSLLGLRSILEGWQQVIWI